MSLTPSSSTTDPLGGLGENLLVDYGSFDSYILALLNLAQKLPEILIGD